MLKKKSEEGRGKLTFGGEATVSPFPLSPMKKDLVHLLKNYAPATAIVAIGRKSSSWKKVLIPRKGYSGPSLTKAIA